MISYWLLRVVFIWLTLDKHYILHRIPKLLCCFFFLNLSLSVVSIAVSLAFPFLVAFSARAFSTIATKTVVPKLNQTQVTTKATRTPTVSNYNKQNKTQRILENVGKVGGWRGEVWGVCVCVRKRHRNGKEMGYSCRGNDFCLEKCTLPWLWLYFEKKSTVSRQLTHNMRIKNDSPTLNLTKPTSGLLNDYGTLSGKLCNAYKNDTHLTQSKT